MQPDFAIMAGPYGVLKPAEQRPEAGSIPAKNARARRQERLLFRPKEKMSKRIALTVDLEPDWGVRGTRAFQEVTPRFLRFLEDRRMRATFFVVSSLTKASPIMISALAERNEVASHGCTHRLLDRLDEAEVQREMRASRERLQACGVKVEGFRAPYFRRCKEFFKHLAEAGYRYDASMGSVVLSPVNWWLHRMPCPYQRDSVYEFPTSAMGMGLLPLSLTWLRFCAPLTRRLLPGSASLIYLHLHDFLPAETASCLPLPLRRLLTRNCGERAWAILDRSLDALSAEFTTCGDMLGDYLARESAGRVQVN
jgi:peptidoglycan/xylan/chitin deacetylase (PgdA/CDA1 family)